MIFVVYKADAGCKFRVCYFFADSVRFSDQPIPSPASAQCSVVLASSFLQKI